MYDQVGLEAEGTNHASVSRGKTAPQVQGSDQPRFANIWSVDFNDFNCLVACFSAYKVTHHSSPGT
jgi:hypothetical protein